MAILFRLQPVLVIIALALALMFPLLALGTKFEIWNFRTAFSLIGGCALTAAIVLAIAGAGLIGAIRDRNIKAKTQSSLAILILIAPMATLFYHGYQASQVPAIHDISTDTDNPPQFQAVSELRQEGDNSLDINPEVITLQKQGYPDLVSLKIKASKANAINKVEQAAKELGWTVVSVNRETGVVEAFDQSFWFGFVDDVVIRVKPAESGYVFIDARSASRVGQSDLGKNAQRIRALFAKLQ